LQHATRARVDPRIKSPKANRHRRSRRVAPATRIPITWLKPVEFRAPRRRSVDVSSERRVMETDEKKKEEERKEETTRRERA